MKLSTIARVAAGAALGTALVALAPPSATPATATASTAASGNAGGAYTAAAQNCWDGPPRSVKGARMEYKECRRDWGKTQQSSISIRVKDTRNDGKCAGARGRIGYSKDPNTVHTRVTVSSCTTDKWSAWKRSGWWNGDQAYEYVYLY